MRRRDFLKGLPRCGSGRREGTGPPPPAARVLRIALRDQCREVKGRARVSRAIT